MTFLYISFKNISSIKNFFINNIKSLINDPCLKKLTKSPEKSSLIRSYSKKDNALFEWNLSF